MARTFVSKSNIMMLALAAWVVNHPRETRVLVVTVALAAMMIFAFSSPDSMIAKTSVSDTARASATWLRVNSSGMPVAVVEPAAAGF